MADKKISQFDNGGAIQPTDEIATNRAGVNTKVFVGTSAALDTGTDPNQLPTNADLDPRFADIGKVKASLSDTIPSELIDKLIAGSNVSINLDVDSSGNEYLVIAASAGATSLPDGDYGNITVSGSGSIFTIKTGVVTTTNLGGDITAAGKALLDDADAAAQRATLGLANAALTNTSNTFSGGSQKGAVVALTQAATIAVDFSLSNNFYTTMTGNRTLGAPSNVVAGQSGAIELIQDGTGSRTLAYNSAWKFVNGADPVLTTSASAVDVLFYYVGYSGTVYASFNKAFA